MCVYIGQYYAINLMFNSDSLAAFMLGSEGGAALSSSGHTLPLPGISTVSQLHLWAPGRRTLLSSTLTLLLVSIPSQSNAALTSPITNQGVFHLPLLAHLRSPLNLSPFLHSVFLLLPMHLAGTILGTGTGHKLALPSAVHVPVSDCFENIYSKEEQGNTSAWSGTYCLKLAHTSKNKWCLSSVIRR